MLAAYNFNSNRLSLELSFPYIPETSFFNIINACDPYAFDKQARGVEPSILREVQKKAQKGKAEPF